MDIKTPTIGFMTIPYYMVIGSLDPSTYNIHGWYILIHLSNPKVFWRPQTFMGLQTTNSFSWSVFSMIGETNNDIYTALESPKRVFLNTLWTLSEDEILPFLKLNHVKQRFLWVPNIFHRSLEILNQLNLKIPGVLDFFGGAKVTP